MYDESYDFIKTHLKKFSRTYPPIFNSLPTRLYCMLFYIYFGPLNFFKINYFEKCIPGMHSECQTVWIQIEPELAQTFCKGYHQSALVGKEVKVYRQF